MIRRYKTSGSPSTNANLSLVNPEANHPPLPHPRESATEVLPVPSAADAPARDPRLWIVPLLVLALVQFGAPFVPVPSFVAAIVCIVALTLVYVGATVVFSLALARRQMALPVLGVGLVIFALVFGAMQKWMPPRFPFAYVWQNFALLGLGTFGGLFVSRMIRHANMIGPIGVMVAVIDIWGVLFGGIVSQLLTNKATKSIAQTAMASGPKLGAATSKFHLVLPDIGIGDYLFLALFLGCLVRFGMNWRTSALWMWFLVSLALLAIVLGVPALPGLVPIAFGALAPNLRHFQFTRDERFALLYAGVFVLILTIGLYFGLTSMLPTK